MKTKLLLVLLWTIHIQNNAQVFGPEQIILTGPVVEFIHAADLDSDGDIDILYPWDNKIYWHENGGAGNFGPEQTIASNTNHPQTVYAIDLDQDGDIDVLSTSYDNIAWYENDGLGNFGPQQIITTNVDGIVAIFADDLDGDGDMDVISTSGLDHKIAWYENTDGLGNFGTQQIVAIDPYFPQSGYTVDLDLDGDMDVLVSSISSLDDTISWYENDGSGNFGLQQIITTNVNGIAAIHISDIDGDGDTDVLSASMVEHELAWYENDGNGNFGPQLLIATDPYFPLLVYGVDIDLDGDMDVISFINERIVWYDNTDGQGNFGPLQIIAENVTTLHAYPSDLDGDGDKDLLAANVFIFDGMLAWYENLTILSIDENTILDFAVYPNPSSDKIFVIVQNLNYSELLVEIIDFNSKVVFSKRYQWGDEVILSRGGLAAGAYIMRITTNNDRPIGRKIILD